MVYWCLVGMIMAVVDHGLWFLVWMKRSMSCEEKGRGSFFLVRKRGGLFCHRTTEGLGLWYGHRVKGISRGGALCYTCINRDAILSIIKFSGVIQRHGHYTCTSALLEMPSHSHCR
jgi:hypothetical protein